MKQKQKAQIAAAVCLIAAAGSAVYIKNHTSESRSVAGSPKPAARADLDSKGSSDSANSKDTGVATKARGKRDAGAFPDLVARFGSSRVQLVKTVTSDLVVGIEQITPFFQKAEAGYVKPSSLSEAYRNWPGLAEQIELSEEQQAALIEQLGKTQKDKFQMFYDAPRTIHENREKLLETLLARDAASRGEFPVEESRILAEQTNALLGPLMTLMNQDSEPSIVKSVGGEDNLRAILNESQMAKLKELEEKRAQEGEGNKQSGGNGKKEMNLSVMTPSLSGSESLEDLAVQMQDFKKATAAISQLLEVLNKDETPAK